MLKSPYISHLPDLQILYVARPEALERFEQYRQNALAILAEPIGEKCIQRADEFISEAKMAYADVLLADEVGAVRYGAGCILRAAVNAVVSLNNTYIRRSIKHYLEELREYRYLPKAFEERYLAVVHAKSIEELRTCAFDLLKGVVDLRDRMYHEYVQKPKPGYDALAGTYEELWCNCRNKVLASTEAGDLSYAFLAAVDAQSYLDEMAVSRGTKKFDSMKHCDPDDLSSFRAAFLEAMEGYLQHYAEVHRSVKRFDCFDQLYEHFMGIPGK